MDIPYLTADNFFRFAANARRFGMSQDEASQRIVAIASVPLPPELERMLALAGEGLRPGWWKSWRGWKARREFRRWQTNRRRT